MKWSNLAIVTSIVVISSSFLLTTITKEMPPDDSMKGTTPLLLREEQIISQFEYSWKFLKENEGGYSNQKFDRGGATMYGISTSFLKLLSKEEGDINHDGKIDENDTRIISENKAKELYARHFWAPIMGDSIHSHVSAAKLFDTAVNIGVGKAVKVAQKVCNMKNIDGRMGHKTINAINAMDPLDFISKYIDELRRYYIDICKKHYWQMKFLNGWIARAYRIPE